MRCPTCLQPYLRIGTLQNPLRTIYIHREVGKDRKPVDFCMRKQGYSVTPEVIEECQRLNKPTVEEKKNIASCLRGMVNSKQPKEGHNIKSGEDNKMPFVSFNLTNLKEKYPVVGPGRAGKPSIAISEKGRMVMSSEVTKAFAGCKVVLPGFDKAANKLAFQGYAEAPKGKEANSFDLIAPAVNKKTGKVSNKSFAVGNANFILKEVGYDFVKAGNQTYVVDKLDPEKHTVTFALPTTLPTPKAKVERKRKPKTPPVDAKAAKAGAGTNGSAATSGNSGNGGGNGKVAEMPAPQPNTDDEIVVE